ncbi:MAG: hypothetical protein JRI97_07080, partial [Deltaproteobacteria bacterium]|nr:hypothetical protein [Deltaproteobacteria bacterium]
MSRLAVFGLLAAILFAGPLALAPCGFAQDEAPAGGQSDPFSHLYADSSGNAAQAAEGAGQGEAAGEDP